MTCGNEALSHGGEERRIGEGRYPALLAGGESASGSGFNSSRRASALAFACYTFAFAPSASRRNGRTDALPAGRMVAGRCMGGELRDRIDCRKLAWGTNSME